VHGVGVVGPRLELVCEYREFLLEALDVCWVFVEEDLGLVSSVARFPFLKGKGQTYSSKSSLERLQLRQSLALKHLLGNSATRNKSAKGLNGDIPEFLVLFPQNNNQTGRLGVERAGHIQNSGMNQLFDLGVGHGAVLAQLVDGAAGLSRLDECVGHGIGCVLAV